MKQNLFLLALVLTGFSAVGQNFPVHSVSLRLGIPVGFTYKNYISKKESFEFVVGGASPYWSNTYYKNSFNSFSKYKDFKYIDHRVNSTIYLQARYLKDFAIPTSGMEGALNWYCGVGAVMKVARVSYRYTDINSTPPTRTDDRADIDFGPEVILGAEYWLENTPFSFYGEGSAMLELFDRIGGRAFAAIGVRYHFDQ